MYLSNIELKETYGGIKLSGALLGYAIRGMQLLYQFGQSAGSAVKRFISGRMC